MGNYAHAQVFKTRELWYVGNNLNQRPDNLQDVHLALGFRVGFRDYHMEVGVWIHLRF